MVMVSFHSNKDLLTKAEVLTLAHSFKSTVHHDGEGTAAECRSHGPYTQEARR